VIAARVDGELGLVAALLERQHDLRESAWV